MTPPGRLVSHLTRQNDPEPRTRRRRMLIRPLSRRLEPPALTPALHARLAEHLRPDVERFREETGMAFAGWSL